MPQLKRSSLKKISAKEAKVKAEYRRVCKEMDIEMFDLYGCIICISCGRTVATEGRSLRSWGHSHNLPKGRFKELETDKKNISPRCQTDINGNNGCHEALDKCDMHRISQFRDLDSIMAYRKEKAVEEYNKFVTAFKESGIKTKYEYA